jgi:hypothetical protein
MPLFAFVAPIEPNKTEEFRAFIGELNGSRKEEYESSRKNAGFRQEAMFLQKTTKGDMVVLVQDAESETAALTALRGMTDSFHHWYFQQLKDINGIDIAGPPMPQNELLLDYRSD